MSSFFSNIFSGHKSKKNKNAKSESKPPPGIFTSNDSENRGETREDEDIPVPILNRRYSLSKSGRMKEKKRMKIAIKDNFPASEDKVQSGAGVDNDRDFPDKAVFDADGIIDEMNKCCDLTRIDKHSESK
ncbi:unnamed protein product [Acanthoscelides obtectus]|uniref:Uncharacterized protein n=1 Tax=Acanthoscelides obtectus TaxID=200917 RepID=A0A9P0KDR2_ACAOB|nr:unnamed protein product [Acanthoscelides obtectus]CAK1640945.1 hypothetical protein AOBTE_LOCUS12033 [Acanthoscelides obtectus]